MASPNISFSEVPEGIRKPGVYFEYNTSLAVRGLPTVENSVLLLGMRTTGGSVAENVPTKIFGAEDAKLYFGTGSNLHVMATALYKANPYLSDVSCVALDAESGTAAEGAWGFTGTATASGTVTSWIQDQRIDISVAKDDTADEVAAALEAKIAEYEDTLPITAAVTTNKVTMTARSHGTDGNYVPIAQVIDCDGIVTTGETGFIGGATDPSVADALTAVFPGDYSIYISEFVDDTALGLIKAHVDTKSNAIEQRPAIVAYGYTELVGNAAALKTQAGTTLNSGRISAATLEYTTTIGAQASPMQLAAAYGAVLGSATDPAQPYNNLALKGIPAPAVADRFARSVQEDYLDNGVTPIHVIPGEQAAIVRAISTYTTNAAGTADPSMLDITTIRTLDYTRSAVVTRLELRFPRAKLSSRTPARVRTQVLDVLRQLEDLEILEEVDANKDGVLVERDSSDVNRLNVRIPADIVNGLHVLAGVIDLLL